MTDEHTKADIEFHEATAHLYEPVLEPIFGVYLRLVRQPIFAWFEANAPGRRALDVGCGTGVLTVALAERGFTVTGVDHSPGMMRLALDKAAAAGVADRVTLSQGDIRRLPYPDASFDVVTCQGVLHHLDDLHGTLREMHRVLAPGGCLYVSEPCEGSTPALRGWDLLRRAGHLMTSRGRATPAAETAPPPPMAEDAHEEAPLEPARLTSALDDVGFQYEVQYWGRFDGVERLPLRAQIATVFALSRPWQKVGGNLLVVTGRRPR